MSSLTHNKPRRGYVYAIHEVGSMRYKIGHGIDPKRRLKQLQTGNGTELIIYATIHSKDMVKLEGILHDVFSAYKTHHGGKEWFRLDRQSKHLLDIIFNKEQPTTLEKEQLRRLKLV